MKSKYKTGKIIITLENIKKFEFSDDKRKLRVTIVNSLYNALCKGQHFESILVVNKVNSRLRIIDGNHRIEAIKRYLNKFPKEKVQSNLVLYENLSDEEEKEIFQLWNIGTKQTNDDFVHCWRRYIPIYKLLEREFPCKVTSYTGTDSIKFKRLIGAYLKTDTKTGWLGGYKKEDFIAEASKLGRDDHKKLKKFMEGFIIVFGKPNNKNIYAKTALFSAIMRIYFNNIDQYSEIDIFNDFKIYVLGDPELILFSKMLGREAQKKITKIMIDLINKSRKRTYK